jgi:hypothetical protein
MTGAAATAQDAQDRHQQQQQQKQGKAHPTAFESFWQGLEERNQISTGN